MDLHSSARAREIMRMSPHPPNCPGWALRLTPGPNLFTDWRFILCGDVWGGFHWAAKDSDERIPVRVTDDDGEYVKTPIDARFVPEDMPSGIRIVAQPADRSERLAPGQPPGQVMYDSGSYRTWYSPQLPWQARPHQFKGAWYCAESDDGFTWKAQLECVIDWSACPGVNASEPPSVFIDPSAPETERYKMVFLGHSTDPDDEPYRRQVLADFMREQPDDIDPTAMVAASGQETPLIKFGRFGAVSADGINWRVLARPLMLLRSDAQNVVYYDTIRETYVWYLKSQWYSMRRAIARAETKDFRRWPLADTVLHPGPDLAPSDDWYTNSKTIYPGVPDQHLMFPSLYHHFTDTSELRMYTSPDGTGWNQVPGGPVLAPGAAGAWDAGFFVANVDLVPLPGDRIGLPYSGYPYPHKYPRTKHTLAQHGHAYALWPRERLAALVAEERGEFATLPLLFSGRRLRLNMETEVAGEIRVEATISRESGGGGEVLPGRSFAECVPISGDGLDHIVAWHDGEDLGHVPGQPVTLRFRMRSAKLFAFELVD
jgi:hypothetical protein